MAQNLETAYRVDIDTVEESVWDESLRLFDDATLYQTWAYGRMKVGEGKLSHILLWHGSEIAGMSQVRVFKPPFLPMGIAYVHWGPLWMKTGLSHDLEYLRRMLEALHAEYVLRRGLMLRILPKISDGGREDQIRSAYERLGFTWSPDPDQTFFVDLSIPLENIRANLQRDWRRDLKNAEKQGLLMIEGTGPDILAVAIELASEMKERKRYFGAGASNLMGIQRNLSEDSKIKVMYAEYEGEPVAALGWQTLGKVGFPVIAATGNKGLKLKASFLLWWKMIEFYHGRGFRCLDVGGVHAGRNPGGYLFKSRLTGKKDPRPDRYAGQFTAYKGRVFPFLFKAAYIFRNSYKHTRAEIAKVLRARSTRNKRTT